MTSLTQIQFRLGDDDRILLPPENTTDRADVLVINTADAPATLTLQSLRNLTQADILLANLPGLPDRAQDQLRGRGRRNRAGLGAPRHGQGHQHGPEAAVRVNVRVRRTHACPTRVAATSRSRA